MVKNSKYVLLSILLMVTCNVKAQDKELLLNTIKRDSEITRVTLDNHFKSWDGAPLLNLINSAKINYVEGSGLYIQIDAPNSEIYLSNGHNGVFRKDHELLDTFYDADMISLQRQRLTDCLVSFLNDFYDYLPLIEQDENYTFQFNVADKPSENNGELQKSSIRDYQMEVQLNRALMDKIKTLTKKELLEKLKTEIKQR